MLSQKKAISGLGLLIIAIVAVVGTWAVFSLYGMLTARGLEAGELFGEKAEELAFAIPDPKVQEAIECALFRCTGREVSFGVRGPRVNMGGAVYIYYRNEIKKDWPFLKKCPLPPETEKEIGDQLQKDGVDLADPETLWDYDKSAGKKPGGIQIKGNLCGTEAAKYPVIVNISTDFGIRLEDYNKLLKELDEAEWVFFCGMDKGLKDDGTCSLQKSCKDYGDEDISNKNIALLSTTADCTGTAKTDEKWPTCAVAAGTYYLWQTLEGTKPSYDIIVCDEAPEAMKKAVVAKVFVVEGSFEYPKFVKTGEDVTVKVKVKNDAAEDASIEFTPGLTTDWHPTDRTRWKILSSTTETLTAGTEKEFSFTFTKDEIQEGLNLPGAVNGWLGPEVALQISIAGTIGGAHACTNEDCYFYVAAAELAAGDDCKNPDAKPVDEVCKSGECHPIKKECTCSATAPCPAGKTCNPTTKLCE